MNKTRRKGLQEQADKLENLMAELVTLKEEIYGIKSDEEDAYDNLPNGIQESDRGCDMEENIDQMCEIIDALDSVNDELDEALSTLNEVIER